MSKGLILDIDHFAVHDGEGIRTTIYLKGCPLRCVWCHSPESQSGRKELVFISSRCTGCGACSSACMQGLQRVEPSGQRSYIRESCVACGSCAEACPQNALSVTGREMSAEEAAAEAAQDAVFYKNSGGGVTLTGGEVLFQPEFALEILKKLKQHDIHTIVETSGMGYWSDLYSLTPYVDLFYYDIKVMNPDKHKQYTGSDNTIILENVKKLKDITQNIILRVPLIPGYNDRKEDIDAIYRFALDNGFSRIHLLPYNYSAAAKYEWLGRPYYPGKLERQAESYINGLKAGAPANIAVEIMY